MRKKTVVSWEWLTRSNLDAALPMRDLHEYAFYVIPNMSTTKKKKRKKKSPIKICYKS